MFLFWVGMITGVLIAIILIALGVSWYWAPLTVLILSVVGLLSGALCEAAARADQEMEAGYLAKKV